jgi:RHS repeat-associated protein
MQASIRFPGQYYQTETGLNYNYFRDYDPQVGRYVESDPIGLRGGSYSTYSYVRNNPISLMDPLGLCPNPSNCLWAAAKAKGASIGLDIIGAIPVLGNATSATAAIVRAGIAINHVITSPAAAIASGAYGAYGAVTAGPEDATDSIVGAVSASTGIAATLADVSVGGTQALPIVGNVASVLTAAWDAYYAYQIYQSCMAGN